MKVLRAFCLAFSSFSKIPMIRVYRNKENMRCAVCFIPLVGLVIGAALMAWFHLCMRFGIGNSCFAALAAAIPVLITGGIHARGFIKTSEALFFRADKQKRLEIMSGSGTGTLGTVSAVIYYLLLFGFMNEIKIYGEAAMIALGFVMSRALCAGTISLMRAAKNTGFVYELTASVNKAVTLVVTIFTMTACALVMIFLSPYIGGAVLLFLTALMFYYKFFAAKKIGGITFDTCGWLIQVCELVTVIVTVIGGKLV